jgi:Ni/Co efflux regulator RcnB
MISKRPTIFLVALLVGASVAHSLTDAQTSTDATDKDKKAERSKGEVATPEPTDLHTAAS